MQQKRKLFDSSVYIGLSNITGWSYYNSAKRVDADNLSSSSYNKDWVNGFISAQRIMIDLLDIIVNNIYLF